VQGGGSRFTNPIRLPMLPLRTLKRVATVLVGVGLCGGVVGQLRGWFLTIPWYDEVLHAFTAFALTAAIGSHLYLTGMLGRAQPLVAIGLLACVGLALGALWEIGEWVTDKHLATIIRDDTDTMLDLIADAVGSLVGGSLVVLVARRQGESTGDGPERSLGNNTAQG
jgi:hypothetical protein